MLHRSGFVPARTAAVTLVLLVLVAVERFSVSHLIGKRKPSRSFVPFVAMFNFLFQGKVGEMMAPIKSPEAQLLIAIQNRQADKVRFNAYEAFELLCVRCKPSVRQKPFPDCCQECRMTTQKVPTWYTIYIVVSPKDSRVFMSVRGRIYTCSVQQYSQ